MRCVMCQPHNNWIDYRSQAAFHNGVADMMSCEEVVIARPRSSLLAYGFNIGFAEALNRGVDWFVMLHADVEPLGQGWVSQLLADADERGLDIIHAPVPIKDGSGNTSTAVVRELDPWTRRKRLTLAELAQLPDVFTVEDVQASVDPEALLLLPNTGCHAVRMGEWCSEFFYTIEDKIVYDGEKYTARSIPEDWRVGFDAHRLGLRVGGTNRVKVNHHGMAAYSTAKVWGQDRDVQFDEWAAKNLTTVG